MPHSSGGGSHGGGSHGGSHGGSSSTSHATKYFPGAHHYVYYKNGKAHHFYNKEPITPESIEKKRKSFRIIAVILALFYSVALVGIISAGAFGKAHVPNTHYSDKDIEICDKLGLFDEDEEEDLYDALEEFQDMTGVTPYVLTIDNSEWKKRYSKLENYAYDKYLELFDDEMHWLLVYSTDGDEDWEDWYWEGMQGDDTDPVLTTYNTDVFTKSFHKYISDDDYSVAEALIKSLDKMEDGMFDRHVNLGLLIGGTAFILIHGTIMFFGMWAAFMSTAKTEKIAFELPVADKTYLEDKCEYCGGLFIHGIHISCPHCGGALPPADGPIFVQNPGSLS